MSDRTSENSFVCTTSFLQTEELMFVFNVQDGVNIGKKTEENAHWITLCKQSIAI